MIHERDWAAGIGILLLLLPQQAGAGKGRDVGLYSIGESSSGELLECVCDSSRELVWVGKQLSVASTVELTSLENDNSRFRLKFVAVDRPEVDYVKRVGDRCFRPAVVEHWRGSSVQDVQAEIPKSCVGDVERACGVEPTLRSHPGFRLCVSARPMKTVFHAGEEPILSLFIKNIGVKDVRWTEFFGPAVQVEVLIRDRHGQMVAEREGYCGEFRREPTDRSLSPDAELELPVDLSGRFHLGGGQYTAVLMYRMDFGQSEDSLRWQERAAAGCEFRIVE